MYSEYGVDVFDVRTMEWVQTIGLRRVRPRAARVGPLPRAAALHAAPLPLLLPRPPGRALSLLSFPRGSVLVRF